MDDMDGGFDDWTDTEDWDDDEDEDDEATAGRWDTDEDDEDEYADLDDDEDDDEAFDEDEEADWDGGAVGARPEHSEPRSEQAVSAWDFGTGVAVAGWLLDRHAEKITEAVRAATPAAHDAAGSGVPAWARLGGAGLDSAAEPLQPGDRLERSRLHRSLRLHADAGRDLVLEARPMVEQGSVRAGGGLDWSALRFTILHTTLVDRLPLWVLFDEREQGFSSARLLPVFVDTARRDAPTATSTRQPERCTWSSGAWSATGSPSPTSAGRPRKVPQHVRPSGPRTRGYHFVKAIELRCHTQEERGPPTR